MLMKKILSLLWLLMLAMTSAWAGEVATFDLSKSPGVSTPEGFFTHEAASAAGKWNWNNKFKGAEYDGMSFSQGLKMEGATAIDFSTDYVSTVTIVQSTWSANTIKLDGNELAVADATEGTGCRIYTINNVDAGDHTISRGSGESGLFYIKVEWQAEKTVTFVNDANWEKVYVWAFNDTENFTGGTWPGVELTGVEGFYQWKTTGTPTTIVFNDGGTNQTDEMEFKNDGVYKSTGRVINLSEFTATFKTDGMDAVWAYVWNGDEKALGEWPGTQMQGGNGEFSVTIQAEEAPKFIVFHDNQGHKTPDWNFEDGKAYEYNLNTYTATFTTDAAWENVYAYVWDGKEENKLLGDFPGQQLVADNGVYTLTMKAFAAPENIRFSGGDDASKTPDMSFTNGRAYKWNTTLAPLYALEASEAAIPAGTTVEVKDGEEVVATLTYGVSGGADFVAPTARQNEEVAAFQYYTGGNGENGSADGGTIYTIKPVFDGTITVGVWLNGGKSFFIQEDGTSLEGFNGIKKDYGSSTTFEFAVKAGSEYKVYCTGSKLGFYGFDYQYSKPEPIVTTATFDFASPNFRENIGEAMADTKGFIYNETFTAEDVTLQITSGSAPSRIYVDNNRGQNLVTYKEYTTLTFRAPYNKAITKIEFTAAGNSNINGFTASSGTIEGMVWTGNAAGVRFAQGATSYLANAIVTLEDVTATTASLPEIQYTEVANIAAFNALEPGTYAKLTLKDAEVIGKSADGYSTLWIQDATGGAWVQYTTLNANTDELTKLNGFVYTIKRQTSGNPQLKEAEDTPMSDIIAEGITDYTVVEGKTLAEVNVAENLNRVVKMVADSLVMTSATAGKLYIGQEVIDVNNGTETGNQQLHKIADWAKDTKLENIEMVAILVAKSATANQLLPISIEMKGETVSGEELNLERYPGMGYAPSYATVDLTAAKAFLGVEELNAEMLSIINPDGSEISAYAPYDGWFSGEGAAETWSSLNAEGNVRPGINVKFFEAIPDGMFSICDMNGADEIGKTYTVKWTLKANGKSYIYTINVTFVEAPVVNLQKSDLSIVASVEYPVNCGSYQEQLVSLTDEQVQSILTELGLEKLADADVYGYNPTTGELLSNYAGFDGWRDANGDFANHSGNNTVPACVKYTDGQNYYCYAIAGCEQQTIKTYWAIANAEKYVLVEIDFTYTEAQTIERQIVDLNIKATDVVYDVNEDSYTEKIATITEEQLQQILTELGLQSITDEACQVYVYNPTTKELAIDVNDGWRDANGDTHAWAGNADAPVCVKFTDGLNYNCYNLQAMSTGTYATYWAIANETKAVLVEVDVIYEGIVDGINAITAAQNGEAIYNLQGMRLQKLQKGLNIVGGKKFIVK